MTMPDKDEYEVIIIGAGLSGLGAAREFLRRGIDDVLILERADAVGGTWRDNVYPGAGCDIPSVLYSYSHYLNSDWSRSYSSQQEILAYVERYAVHFNLGPHIAFRSEVVSAKFDEEKGAWEVVIASGRQLQCRFLIGASGPLSNPKFPDIPGLKDFEGPVVHGGRWDSTLDFAGKRVGVIGTGASAIQIVPELAKRAGRLTVFQRSAPYILPKFDVKNPVWLRFFLRFRMFHIGLRFVIYALTELLGQGVFRRRGIIKRIFRAVALRFMKSQISDPDLQTKLIPDYEFGCKRVNISNRYYRSLKERHVRVETSPIKKCHPREIVTADGNVPIDILVLATGYDVPKTFSPIPIQGRSGLALSDAWARGAYAFWGVAVPHFPNFFMLLGPNTGPGHTSVLIYVERQIQYIVDAVSCFRKYALPRCAEVEADKNDDYQTRLQSRMRNTVWLTGCRSWYVSESGENHTTFPGFAAQYVFGARFSPADYLIQ